MQLCTHSGFLREWPKVPELMVSLLFLSCSAQQVRKFGASGRAVFGQGNGGHSVDAPGDLGRFEFRSTRVVEFSGPDFGIEFDESVDVLFARNAAGECHDTRCGNSWVSTQHVLDASGVDPPAAALDHVVQPANDLEVPKVVA